MDCLIKIVTLLAGIAAIITAVVAIPGLSKWKKQLKGTEEYQAGKELMKLTYKVRDHLNYLRSPVIDYLKKTGESEFEALRREHQKRYKRIATMTEQIHEAQSEAEFHWGQGIKDLNYPFWQKVVDLEVTMKIYMRDEESFKRIKDDPEAWGILVKTSNDEYGKEINEMIEKLQKYIDEKIN